MAKDCLTESEPLKEPVTASGTLSAGGTSLEMRPFGGGGEGGGEGGGGKSVSPTQTLVKRRTPYLPQHGGGKYS